MEALPELLGGEWGKGGLVVVVEQGVASAAGVVRQVKKTAESALLPIAEKVASEVQVKAKIAQNTFETVVMRAMDLVEEMGVITPKVSQPWRAHLFLQQRRLCK